MIRLGAIVSSMINNGDEGFLTDGQSYKYFLGEDETSEIITIFMKGIPTVLLPLLD